MIEEVPPPLCRKRHCSEISQSIMFCPNVVREDLYSILELLVHATGAKDINVVLQFSDDSTETMSTEMLSQNASRTQLLTRISVQVPYQMNLRQIDTLSNSLYDLCQWRMLVASANSTGVSCVFKPSYKYDIAHRISQNIL